jgi:hypothetical protein
MSDDLSAACGGRGCAGPACTRPRWRWPTGRRASTGARSAPASRRTYDALTAALDRVDNRLRRLRLEARRTDPSPADVNGWCRSNTTGSFSAAPGSGGRATLDSLRR